MTTIEELLVVLKGDAREFDRAANEGVRLLTDLDQSAQKATKRLDDVWQPGPIHNRQRTSCAMKWRCNKQCRMP